MKLHYLVLMAIINVELWLMYMHCLLIQCICMYRIDASPHAIIIIIIIIIISDGHNDTHRGCSGVALLAGTSI